MEEPDDDTTYLFPGPSSPEAEIATQVGWLLKAEDWELRAASAKALGQRGDPRAVEALCLALTDRIWRVRMAAIGALGYLKDPRGVVPLCGALEDPDWYVRVAAAVALGAMKDVRAAEPLCATLADSEETVRSAAVSALGEIGDAWAFEALCGALKDREKNVRWAAGRSLKQMGTTAALPLRVLSSMTMTPAKMLDTLEALAEAAPTIEERIVRYQIGDVQALCERLYHGSDTEESVRRGAEAVLMEIRNRAASHELLRGSARDERREQEELLRGASGHSAPTAPEELLRASDPSHPPKREKQGWLTRLFKKR